MTDVSFVQFASYGSVFDAELDRTRLEEAGIPAIVRGAHPGVHGAGFSGMYIGGVELYVPDVALDDVREVLGWDGGDDVAESGDAPASEGDPDAGDGRDA